MQRHWHWIRQENNLEVADGCAEPQRLTGYEMEESGDNESAWAKTMTESARKEGEVVWACDAR